MEYEDNPRSIKFHVKKYLHEHKLRFVNKTVIDLPAGNGVTSSILHKIGAKPLSFDLFPQYFNVKELSCSYVNIAEGIPLPDKSSDWVICQEGIEHFADQFKVLKEFNRVLRNDGSLIITTPNYSNLRAKLSHLLSESERFTSSMPPNEIDSIWMNDQSLNNEVYFGHVYLIGIHRLRLLARLAGFKIKHIRFTRVKTTSAILLVFLYPFILFFNSLIYWKNVNKIKGYDASYQKQLYYEIFKLSIDPRILVDGHLFIEFQKTTDFNQVLNKLNTVHTKDGTT